MQRDVLIFTAEDSGNFTTKGFKRINRHEGVKRSWARCIWNRTLPPNIAASCGRLFDTPFRWIVGLKLKVSLWLRDAIVAVCMM